MTKINVEQTGFTKEEFEISELLNKARTKFLNLPKTHPSDDDVFTDAFHTIQSILGLRILRRDYPEFWVTIRNEEFAARKEEPENIVEIGD